MRDLNHPEHPLGADDLIGARAQLRLVLTPRTELLMSVDLTQQDGTLLAFNKILQVKPGFTVDNPADLREVRTSTLAASGSRHDGANVRLTAALTASATLVSLTAFRQLDNEYIADADVSELDILSTHIHERQHQFSIACAGVDQLCTNGTTPVTRVRRQLRPGRVYRRNTDGDPWSLRRSPEASTRFFSSRM